MAVIQVQVKLEAGRVDIDQAKLDNYFSDPNGDLARDMRRRAQAVSGAMNVPRGEGPEAGRLQRSKRVEEDHGGRLPTASVVVGREGETDYLGYVLPPGTRPHEITPNTRKALRWVPRGGGVRFAKRVMHPGYRGSDFMNEALPAALR